MKVTAPSLDVAYLPHIRFLLRIEGMVNVGCKFAPDDLTPQTWDELIVIHQERNWIRNKIDEQRRDSNKEHPTLTAEAQAAIEKQRKEMNIPPPGGSIFK